MPDSPNQPVRHLLLLSFRQGISSDQINHSIDQFRELTRKIPGIIHFEHGAYDSPEGLNRGLTYACLLTFENIQARDAYLPHPDHQAFARVHLGPVVQDIVVFDYTPLG